MQITDLRKEQTEYAKANPRPNSNPNNGDMSIEQITPQIFDCFLCHGKKKEFHLMVEGHGPLCFGCAGEIAAAAGLTAATTAPSKRSK